MRWMTYGMLIWMTACGSGMTRNEEATTLAWKARELALRGETDEAIELYRDCLVLQPEWAKVRFDLARVTFEEGQTHFMNHLQHMDLEKTARSAGNKERAEAARKAAEEEKDLADPLLDECARNLRQIFGLSPPADPNHLLNGYIWMGTIHADYHRWLDAKKYFVEAQRLARPGTKAMRDSTGAIALMDDELDKQAAKELGLPLE